MTRRRSITFLSRFTAVLVAGLIFGYTSVAQNHPTAPVRKEAPMSHATGPFDVKLTPQDDKLDPTLARLIIDKQFHGDLEATSKGTMLSAGTAVKGSAGYVAIELVTGTLHGSAPTRSCSSLAEADRPRRSFAGASPFPLPDSGTGQLTGLTGTMRHHHCRGQTLLRLQLHSSRSPLELNARKRFIDLLHAVNFQQL